MRWEINSNTKIALLLESLRNIINKSHNLRSCVTERERERERERQRKRERERDRERERENYLDNAELPSSNGSESTNGVATGLVVFSLQLGFVWRR